MLATPHAICGSHRHSSLSYRRHSIHSCRRRSSPSFQCHSTHSCHFLTVDELTKACPPPAFFRDALADTVLDFAACFLFGSVIGGAIGWLAFSAFQFSCAVCVQVGFECLLDHLFPRSTCSCLPCWEHFCRGMATWPSTVLRAGWS